MRAIQRGLETIPEDQRMAVILCDVQELSYEEIAAAMGTSIGTVKSRISRGRSRLRDFLLESGELDSSVGRLVGYEQEEGASPSARGEP
jgi:RNA polymerase sigma-70 factor (ECF subfamily)